MSDVELVRDVAVGGFKNGTYNKVSRVYFNDEGSVGPTVALTIRKSPHPQLLTIGDGMVVINMEIGEITFGPDYTPDEAARLFMEALKTYCKNNGAEARR